MVNMATLMCLRRNDIRKQRGSWLTGTYYYHRVSVGEKKRPKWISEQAVAPRTLNWCWEFESVTILSWFSHLKYQLIRLNWMVSPVPISPDLSQMSALKVVCVHFEKWISGCIVVFPFLWVISLCSLSIYKTWLCSRLLPTTIQSMSLLYRRECEDKLNLGLWQVRSWYAMASSE